MPIAYCLFNAYCLLPIAYCLLPIAYCLLPDLDAYCPGWMHSAWPGCILPRLDAVGRRMHLAWMHSAAPLRSGSPPGPAAPAHAWGAHGPGPDSVMPRQRYAFPALCLAATGGCLPKIITCPRNRSSGGFYNYPCFVLSKYKRKFKMGDPPNKSRIDCNLPIKTFVWSKHMK